MKQKQTFPDLILRYALGLIIVVGLGYPIIGMADTVATPGKLELSSATLLKLHNVQFAAGSAKQLKDFNTQPATDKTEDASPSGPDLNAPPVFLADVYESQSRNIRNDFDNHLPYSHKLIRDHSSLNTYYFYPSGYLLKHDAKEGFALNFLHRTRESESENELIVMTFTIAPRQIIGALPLINHLANEAIKPLNKKPVSLNRLPISSVKVVLQSLTSMISAENVRVINSPQTVGDEIKVQATMTQSEKEDVVASIRNGGLSGDLVFTTNNNSFELVIPYLVSFTSYAGEWITDITNLQSTESIKNVSPYPLALTEVVAYAKKNNQVQRVVKRLAEPGLIAPGAAAVSDIAFKTLFADKGELIAAWPVFEKVASEEYLNEIERSILVSPGLASKSPLAIEAIPNVFTEFSIFKLVVEIRSENFSAGEKIEQIKTVTLRADQTQAQIDLYLDKDKDKNKIYEYRIKPYHSEGAEFKQSTWIRSDGGLDITISKKDIQPLVIP
jgi:hypothetical protein